MVQDKKNSHRHQKRVVAEGLRKLKGKPGWDPTVKSGPSPEEALRDLGQAERTDGAYSDSEACEDCLVVRRDQDDESALCATHLAAAMGF